MRIFGIARGFFRIAECRRIENDPVVHGVGIGPRTVFARKDRARTGDGHGTRTVVRGKRRIALHRLLFAVLPGERPRAVRRRRRRRMVVVGGPLRPLRRRPLRTLQLRRAVRPLPPRTRIPESLRHRLLHLPHVQGHVPPVDVRQRFVRIVRQGLPLGYRVIPPRVRSRPEAFRQLQVQHDVLAARGIVVLLPFLRVARHDGLGSLLLGVEPVSLPRQILRMGELGFFFSPSFLFS